MNGRFAGARRALNSYNFSAYDQFSHPVWVVDSGNALVFANQALTSFLDCSKRESSTASWLKWVSPDDNVSVSNSWYHSIKTAEPFSVTCKLVNAAGECVWYAIQATLLSEAFMGNVDSEWWLFSGINIHLQKSRESQLLNSLYIKDRMINGSPDCIKIIDPRGNVAEMNEAGCIALSVDANSGFGMPWLGLLADSCQDAGKTALAEANKGNIARFAGISEGGESGLQFWDNLLTPFVDENGNTTSILCVSRDLSEQRRTEIELRASRERLELATQAAQLGSFDYLPDKNTIWCDQRTRELFGSNLETDSLLVDEFLEQIDSEDRGVFLGALRQALNSTGTRKFDLEIHTRACQTIGQRTLVAKGIAVFDNNKCARVIGTLLDVTADRANHRKLQEAEERIRLAVVALNDVVWDWDITKNKILWNDALESNYGYASSSAVSHPQWKFLKLHPDDRERVRSSLLEVLNSARQTWSIDYRFERQNGTYADIQDRGYIIRDVDGKPVRMVGAMLDQSDRKSAERHLQQLNHVLESRVAQRTAELQRLWDTSPDLLLVAGSDGIIKRANPASVSILGFEPTELVGRHILHYVDPENFCLAQNVFSNAFSTDISITEIQHIHADGSKRWIAWAVVGTANEIFCTGRHMTDAKASATALQQAEEALRQSQKVEAIGKLTGGVAHDFNNFLTVIRGATDMLRKPNLSEQRRQQYLEAIAITSERAVKLTSQLLAFARRSPLEPTTFCAVKNLRGMEEVLKTLCGPSVCVNISYEGNSCYIFADTNQFDTAILNMAVNARDAMQGKGEFRIHVKPVTEIPSTKNQQSIKGDFIAVTLSDTGTGVESENLDHIFEPFFTTKETGQGTGLGLSQVHGFAHQSGGAVRVRNLKEQGASFTVYLPRSFPERKEIAEASDRKEQHTEQLRILVVEDHEEVGNFAKSVLEEFGHTAVLATSADHALKILQNNSDEFDIVFSDVVMPNMNGIEFAKEVRSKYRNISILLTSGYSDVLAEEGSHGFVLLKKPYSIADLSRALQKVA